MKEREPAAAASPPNASGFPMPTAGAAPQPAPMDRHAVRRQALARGLQLGSLLQVPVVVDHTGWLDRGIEIIYRRESGGAIQPCAVRVGSEASDEDVLADGGALGICHKYNEAIAKLRKLAIRLATVVRDADIAVVAGSALDEAQRELLGLDGLVASRQLRLMGNGVVRLVRLRSEIAFFEERHASLMPVVMAAEQEAHPSWDADTQELNTIP